MAVIHIPEEEAVRDFGAVLSRLDKGEEIIIDRRTGELALLRSTPVRPLTFAEAVERLPENSTAVMDEDFARDVRSFRERHNQPLDSSKWD